MIVGVEQLRAYMSNVRLNDAQWSAAEDVINGVEGEIALELNRPLTPQTVTETVEVDDDGYLMFSVTPVRSVTSLQDGTGRTVPYQTVRGAVRLDAYAALTVDVTYVGGLDGTNDPLLKLEVLRIAAREMQNRHDDTLSVKGTDRRDVPMQPIGLTDDDRRRLQRWRRRVVR